jgi:hypothetical protein
MFASIRRYRVEGSLQDLARRAKEGLVPVFQQNPGFVAYYIVDGGDGYAASVSIFESREAALGSSEQAAAWVKENASEFLPEAPQITAGEALVAVTR